MNRALSRLFGNTTCAECGRVFDMADAQDAEEWAYGHDCEAVYQPEAVRVESERRTG